MSPRRKASRSGPDEHECSMAGTARTRWEADGFERRGFALVAGPTLSPSGGEFTVVGLSHGENGVRVQLSECDWRWCAGVSGVDGALQSGCPPAGRGARRSRRASRLHNLHRAHSTVQCAHTITIDKAQWHTLQQHTCLMHGADNCHTHCTRRRRPPLRPLPQRLLQRRRPPWSHQPRMSIPPSHFVRRHGAIAMQTLAVGRPDRNGQ